VPVVSTVADGMLHGHLNIAPVPELPEIERSLEFLAMPLIDSERQAGRPSSADPHQG
jgi:hypothetical protein